MAPQLRVVELKTDKTETQSEVVSLLEELLERAKTGEFEGFAWTASQKDGASKTGWTRSMDFHTLLSGVTTLQWRMISQREASTEVWES